MVIPCFYFRKIEGSAIKRERMVFFIEITNFVGVVINWNGW